MKFLMSSFLLILAFSAVHSQAFDFTEYDIDGNSHHLYEEMEPNKVAILFFATTWSSTSWNVHNTNVLQEVYENYGPNGKNVLVMHLLESDFTTTIEDILGTGPNTKGDWSANANYPIFNLNTDQIPSKYNINSTPTIKFIDTSRTVIDENLFGLDFNVEYISALIDSYYPETSAVNEGTTDSKEILIMPNPVIDVTTISCSHQVKPTYIEIYTLNGRLIKSLKMEKQLSDNFQSQLDLNVFPSGAYILRLKTSETSMFKKFVKS